MKIFTIYDNKAKAYLQPFFSRNLDTAMREIKQVVNTPDHAFNIHADDYGMFDIGEYDENNGKIESQPPVHVINLIELKMFDSRQMDLPGLDGLEDKKENIEFNEEEIN